MNTESFVKFQKNKQNNEYNYEQKQMKKASVSFRSLRKSKRNTWQAVEN